MVDQSAQHGSRVDDVMEHEVENEVRGAPGSSRAREDLLPDDAVTVPLADPGDERQHREVLERSELARFLRPSTLPADAARLLEAAREEQATDAVMDELGHLPTGVTYASVGEIWAALGHEMEHRREAEHPPRTPRPPVAAPVAPPAPRPTPPPEPVTESGGGPVDEPSGPVAAAVGLLRAGLGVLDGALALVQRAVSRSR
jgi:hypothetical protein